MNASVTQKRTAMQIDLLISSSDPGSTFAPMSHSRSTSTVAAYAAFSFDEAHNPAAHFLISEQNAPIRPAQISKSPKNRKE
jgi:hypothetical protein